MGKEPPFFFLDFASNDKKKISYANSFDRAEFQIKDPQLRKYVHYACNRLDAVSVRENDGVAIMDKEFDRDATRVLDPVFLMEPDEYLAIAKAGTDLELDGEYVFSYILGTHKKKINIYKQVVKALGIPTVNFANPNCTRDERVNHSLKIVSEESVENWLTAINNSRLVIANSYHAVCFAVILQKDFIVILNRDPIIHSRFATLLGLLELKDRIVFFNDDEQKVDLQALADTPIDYTKVEKLLHAEKARSFAWLKNQLQKAPKPVDPNSLEIEAIAAHLRTEAATTRNQLIEARKGLKPLNDLSKAPDGDTTQTAKAHLTSSFIMRQAFRMEYWRCHLILRIVPIRKEKHYISRKRAVKLAHSILLNHPGSK